MRGRRWTQKEVFKARQLRAMGFKNYEIAEKLGRSYKAIGELFFAIRKGKLHAEESKQETA